MTASSVVKKYTEMVA